MGLPAGTEDQLDVGCYRLVLATGMGQQTLLFMESVGRHRNIFKGKTEKQNGKKRTKGWRERKGKRGEEKEEMEGQMDGERKRSREEEREGRQECQRQERERKGRKWKRG